MTTYDQEGVPDVKAGTDLGPDGPPDFPAAVPQTVDNLIAELEATSELAPTSQDDLLTFLDELLDNALHDEGCYVNPDDTVCFCLIGKVRAVLPRCEARLAGYESLMWACQRTAHPASPDRHVFGAV